MRRLALVLVPFAAAAVACGSEPSAPIGDPGPSPTASEPAAFPVTIEAANGPVEIVSRPQRIVSISPTATEILFAIDAGGQVAAVDDFSNFPPEAPVTDLSGFEPNVEAIATFAPDLVVLSFDPGGIVDGLEALAIPTLLQPPAAELDDAYGQIEQLGLATGHPDEAAELVASMEEDIAALAEELPVLDEPVTYYHELDDTYYSATSKTFIGQIYALFGLENIADAAKGAASGYPQLSAEHILEADPDLIFLADTKCCGQTATTVAKRPGWGRLTAVRTGSVVELDDDVASRWGPRIVDLLRDAAGAVRELEAAA